MQSNGLRALMNAFITHSHYVSCRASLFRPCLLHQIFTKKKESNHPHDAFSFYSSDNSERREVSRLLNLHGVGEAVTAPSSCNQVLRVVIVSPQIPGNTGGIARTCAAASVALHLVEPLGFQVDDTKLKRAGLDYWPYVVVKIHSSWSEFKDYFRQLEGEKRLLAFTKSGSATHSDFQYRRGDWLVFGSETSGLPPEVLLDCQHEGSGGATIRIPMVLTYVRCLNISVSVGIALYEASRQLHYEQLQYTEETETCIDGQVPLITKETCV